MKIVKHYFVNIRSYNKLSYPFKWKVTYLILLIRVNEKITLCLI